MIKPLLMSKSNPNNNLRIAMMEPVGSHGGMHYYDIGLIEGLRAASTLALLYTSGVENLPEQMRGTTYYFFKDIFSNSNLVNKLYKYIKAILMSIVHARLRGCRLVHYHVFKYTALELFQVVAAKLLRFKIILTAHDVESFYDGSSRFVAKLVYYLADGIIVHNRISYTSMLNKVPRVSDKIGIIPHGNYISYSTQAPSKASAREKLGVSSNASVVLFFGQIKKVKGLDILLRAWQQVTKANSNAILLVAGKLWRDDISHYTKLIDECKMINSVRLDIRYIPDDEALLYYSSADVVVLPYRQIYQSGVLLMAMSQKKAVLASDLPGMKEIICDGKNGYLFKDGDYNELARILIKVIDDPINRDVVAIAGYETAKQYHDWNAIGVKTKDFYRHVIGAK